MSNQQSPSKTNKVTPLSQSKPNSCVPTSNASINDPAARAIQRDKPPPVNTPSKSRRGVPTLRQPQGTKQPALGTPSNSLACVPRDRTTLKTNITTQRALVTRDKPSPIFDPPVTSTPKSSPIRETQHEQPLTTGTTGGTAREVTQPDSCPPRSLRPPEDGRQLYVLPVSPGSAACVPRNFTEICMPAELVDGTASRADEVRGERILKLEILAIRGGTLYDLDRIHHQSSSSRPSEVEPTYDPRFDIDRVEDVRTAKEVSEDDSDVKTLLSEDHKRESTEEERRSREDEDTLEARSSNEESTVVRNALATSESSFTHDSTLTGPPAAPRKRMRADSNEEYDVWRSVPAAPVTFTLSDSSLTDMPPVREEREDEEATALPFMRGEELILADDKVETDEVPIPQWQLSLTDDDAEMGDVSVPRVESDDDDLTDPEGKTNANESGGARRRKREVGEDEGNSKETGSKRREEADTGTSKLETKAVKEEKNVGEGADRQPGVDEKKQGAGADEGRAMGTDGEVDRRMASDGNTDGKGSRGGTRADRQGERGTAADEGEDTLSDGKRGKERGTDTESGADTTTGKGRTPDGARPKYTNSGSGADNIDEKSGGREADIKPESGRETGRAESAARTIDSPDGRSKEETVEKGSRGKESGAGKRQKDTGWPKSDEERKADATSEVGQLKESDKDKVEQGASLRATGRSIPAGNRQDQADETVDDQRGSVSLILGPSVRNFAHLALSPLTSLRAFLGPAPNSRPSRRKRFRRIEDQGHSTSVRMRSARSALVITPYEAAATSLDYLLRRRNPKRARKTGSAESESSSNED